MIQSELFAGALILKDFDKEPVFGLVNLLQLERQEKREDVFDFYQSLQVNNQSRRC